MAKRLHGWLLLLLLLLLLGLWLLITATGTSVAKQQLKQHRTSHAYMQTLAEHLENAAHNTSSITVCRQNHS